MIMSDLVLLIRHCEATGQNPDALLTDRGREQAIILAERLHDHTPKKLVSSPFTRALDSVRPLAARLKLEVATDDRLAEWQIMPDATSDSIELRQVLDGTLPVPAQDEPRDDVLARVQAALGDAWSDSARCTALVGHGKLFSVLLSDLTGRPATDIWVRLTNPDVFVLRRDADTVGIERLWDD